jgi:hypothetical protein
MTQLLLAMLDFGDNPAMGLWLFLSVGAVSLFVIFLPLVNWIESRRKEREAFYRADTMRRISESTTDGAKSALELLRMQERTQWLKKREGMKVGGLINIGVGIGLYFLLYQLSRHDPDVPYMVGAIPGLVGVAMLVYVYFLAAPVE